MIAVKILKKNETNQVFVFSPTSRRSPGEYSTAERFSSAMTNVSGRNNSSRTQENLSPTALPGRRKKGSDWLTDSGLVHFCRCENDQAEKFGEKIIWKHVTCTTILHTLRTFVWSHDLSLVQFWHKLVNIRQYNHQRTLQLLLWSPPRRLCARKVDSTLQKDICATSFKSGGKRNYCHS